MKYPADIGYFIVSKHLRIPDKSYSFETLEINQNYSHFTREVLTDRKVKGLTTFYINRPWMNCQLSQVF